MRRGEFWIVPCVLHNNNHCLVIQMGQLWSPSSHRFQMGKVLLVPIDELWIVSKIIPRTVHTYKKGEECQRQDIPIQGSQIIIPYWLTTIVVAPFKMLYKILLFTKKKQRRKKQNSKRNCRYQRMNILVYKKWPVNIDFAVWIYRIPRPNHPEWS